VRNRRDRVEQQSLAGRQSVESEVCAVEKEDGGDPAADVRFHGRDTKGSEPTGAGGGDEQAAEQRGVTQLLVRYAGEFGGEVIVRSIQVGTPARETPG